MSTWNWPPVSADTLLLSTYIFAQTDGFPGGGRRAVQGWKEKECDTLKSLGFGETYAWCD